LRRLAERPFAGQNRSALTASAPWCSRASRCEEDPCRREKEDPVRRSDIEEIEYLLDEDPAEAVVLCRRLVDEGPDDADAWGWLAEAQIENGEYDQALKSLAEYAVRDPDWMEAYTLRAGLLAELGRFDAANVELEVARALDSEDPRFVRAEALWHELQGRFTDADQLYVKAAEIDPAYPPPPRFDRKKVKATIERILRDVGKDGLKLQAVFEEIPAKTPDQKLLSRGLELRDDKTLVVYLRNLERELGDDAEIEDLESLFEDRLAELVEAN
jgi:tetratricopeptide (TPR) repeat protein